MKLIPLFDADNLFLAPMLEAGQYDFTDATDPFPRMRSSASVLVFSEDYLSAVTDWWKKYLAATGFKYVPGSQMCERGTRAFLGHIDEEAVDPFSGEGDVDLGIVAAARAQGRDIPTKRLGDFCAGAWQVRCKIPAGVNLNGVTDGGHSTPSMFLHDRDGNVYVVLWEWQNGKWEHLETAVKKGVKILDVID